MPPSISVDNKRRIKIDSILGGHSPTSHFAQVNQFLSSLGIDPAQPFTDTGTLPSVLPMASGLLRPVAPTKMSGSVISNMPLWFIPIPQNPGRTYIYDAAGSAYTMSAQALAIAALSDGGSLSNSSGNGAEYYDNYVYFAKNTTIARYGPLNGTPAFDGDFWATTLGKTPLIDTNYPQSGVLLAAGAIIKFRNHFMHRHSDGRLYFADVVGNQGVIHYIQTTKATVEGDTDNGSKYQALTFGYGLWPIALETYGTNLAIALVEDQTTGATARRQKSAKIAFWDTTSQNPNQIIWVEFPDAIISAMKNINGVLYVVSGNSATSGLRISRFVGGYTFEEVAYIENAGLAMQGAIDGNANRLIIGTSLLSPTTSPGVISYGLQKASLGQGIFYVFSGTRSSAAVTALMIKESGTLRFMSPITGWTSGDSNNSNENGVDAQIIGNAFDGATLLWWSQIYKIGQKFKITKIRIPLATPVTANTIVTPKIYTDEGQGTTYTLIPINNTNDPGAFNVIRKVDANGKEMTGNHNFFLALEWSGADICTVGLPITIEYEILDD